MEQETKAADSPATTTESLQAAQKKPAKKGGWWRLLKAFVLFLLSIVLLAVAAVAVVYQSAQQAPDFYEAALAAPPEELAEDGSKLEKTVLDLRNAAMTPGDWQAVFTDSQINGWLASELKKKFPDLMSKTVTDPRLAVEAGSLKIACRIEAEQLKGIVVCEVDLFLTDVVNQVGVEIKQAKYGLLPVPIASFSEQVTTELGKQGIKVDWKTESGNPVALIDLPDTLTVRDDGNWYEIMDLALEPGELRLTGRTNELEF